MNINFDLYPRTHAPEHTTLLAPLLNGPWDPDHPDCFMFYNEPQLFLSVTPEGEPFLVARLKEDNLADDGNDWRCFLLVSRLTPAMADGLRAGRIDLRTGHKGCEDHVYLIREYRNRTDQPLEVALVPVDQIPEGEDDWRPDAGVLARDPE